MESLYLFGFAVITACALLANWKMEKTLHDRRVQRTSLRIHVNGIRGKSTVTRILAGLLRESGLQTVAKTTGSAACVIDESGVDQPIKRSGAPTILEQVKIIRNLACSVEALVIECMAIKPEYQRVCESKIVQSDIGIITNIREDHQDVLGESLEEISASLLSTCPRNGVLITAERNPRLLPIFRSVAEQRGTKLIVVNPDQVTDAELNAFPYVAFKENIAIGFALAELQRINRNVALRGMVHADPDPGVLRIEQKEFEGVKLTWADLFAVNDRESVVNCVHKVIGMTPENTLKVGLLNNRSDREHRAIQFAKIAANDLELDCVALLGAYEQRVETELIANGVSPNKIIRMGGHRGIEGQALVRELLKKTRDGSQASPKHLLILGLVNIHTRQAESLRTWFGQSEKRSV